MCEDTKDDGCRMELEELMSRVGRLESKVSNLIDEQSSTKHDLERQITDERFDRERADDSIKSDLSSLEHKVDYA